MTTEELILGHFEKSLTLEQERMLQSRLSDSPEARAMFDQHRNLDGMLNSDATVLAPSSRLNETVIAAALATVPEVIGGGSLAWLSGKVAATISAVVIGGSVFGIWLASDSNQAPLPVEDAPAVRTAPAPAVPPVPAVATPAPAIEEPKSEITPAPSRPATRVEAPSAKNDRVKSKEEPKKDRKINLDKPINVDQGTTMKPDTNPDGK
jgi:hypothetical protein